MRIPPGLVVGENPDEDAGRFHRTEKGTSVSCNSQAFWLPTPVDAQLVVTLNVNDLPSTTNQGEVEIHGYIPAAGTRRA